MADSVIELLRICHAHVDPNLLALLSTKKDESKAARKEKSAKRQKRKDNQEGTSGVDKNKVRIRIMINSLILILIELF